MELQFTKMHGAGNDFVFLDCLKNNIDNLEAIAKQLCDRRFGIGADQLLTVHPSKSPTSRWRSTTPTAARWRCAATASAASPNMSTIMALPEKRTLEVETLAGIIRPKIVGDLVEVDMGEPILDGRKIPVDADGEIKNRPLTVEGKTYEITCVSMGNPHLVVYLDDIDSLDLAKLGPDFEHHPFFPKRVNTEFVKIISPDGSPTSGLGARRRRNLGLRHRRQRGGVAGVMTGRTARKLTVHLKGGDLLIEWRDNNRVYMTGGATEVFHGTVLCSHRSLRLCLAVRWLRW